MKKIILALISLLLYAGISTVAYAGEAPTGLSFEIAYEISVPQGRFVFSNQPNKVELITDWQVLQFGIFFDTDETYELRHFPLDTAVAFRYGDIAPPTNS